jgi:hypothetical protein
MCLLLGLIIIIIGYCPIFLIEINPNLMGRLSVHDLTKYAIIHIERIH